MQIDICKGVVDGNVAVELLALKEYNDVGGTVEREWLVGVVDDEYLQEG